MLDESAKTHEFLVSFLYHFGVLSISGIAASGKLELRVPNLVARGLYANRIARLFLLPDPMVRDDGRASAKKVFADGDIGPLCDFVEKRYFRIFHNPGYSFMALLGEFPLRVQCRHSPNEL